MSPQHLGRLHAAAAQGAINFPVNQLLHPPRTPLHSPVRPPTRPSAPHSGHLGYVNLHQQQQQAGDRSMSPQYAAIAPSYRHPGHNFGQSSGNTSQRIPGGLLPSQQQFMQTTPGQQHQNTVYRSPYHQLGNVGSPVCRPPLLPYTPTPHASQQERSPATTLQQPVPSHVYPREHGTSVEAPSSPTPPSSRPHPLGTTSGNEPAAVASPSSALNTNQRSIPSLNHLYVTLRM